MHFNISDLQKADLTSRRYNEHFSGCYRAFSTDLNWAVISSVYVRK